MNRKPRVAVTFSDEALRVLDELAELMGQPKSFIVAEMVEEALPALQTTLEALRVVHKSPEEAVRLMQRFGTEAVAMLAQQQLDLDTAMTDARTIEGKRARRKARASTS